ncbi:hypothetical protein JCM6882_002245 [Rhodosporidiobolus microsporus]
MQYSPLPATAPSSPSSSSWSPPPVPPPSSSVLGPVALHRQRRLLVASVLAIAVLIGLYEYPHTAHGDAGGGGLSSFASAPSRWLGKGAVQDGELYEGTEQLPPHILAVEEPLREMQWSASPDETLMRQIDLLSPSERHTRDWLHTTRRRSSTGTGIGIGAASPPERIRPGRPFARHEGFPGRYDGPGFFEGGSHEKYSRLVREWQEGQQIYAIEKGMWMENYTRLHAEILRGDRETRLIEYTCPEKGACGGLADRMMGMVTAFLMGVASNRAILLTWEQPIPVDLVLDAPYVDWSSRFLPAPAPARHAVYDNETVVAGRVHQLGHVASSDRMMGMMTDLLQDPNTKAASWYQIDAMNRGRVVGMFKNPHAAARLAQLGLTWDTAYAQLMRYLFRPKPPVLDFVHAYSSLFSLPSVYSVGIQIRTGDQSMSDPNRDKGMTVASFQHFFTCAQAAFDTYSKPGQRPVFFLITDSAHLRADAVAKFPNLVISGLHQQHNENDVPKEEVKEGQLHVKGINFAYDGQMATIAETWTFAETDFSVLTGASGFGKFPSFMRGNPHGQIALALWADPRDCRLETSLSPFSELSETWSLG